MLTLIQLKDIEMLHKVFQGYRSHEGSGWLFRGQADSSWDLVPKAGREDFIFQAIVILADLKLGLTKQLRIPNCLKITLKVYR
jgi:hypothetical protein